MGNAGKLKTISIIGCGKVGTLLGSLLHTSGKYCIGQLYSRCEGNAHAARNFIGAGEVLTSLSALKAADIYCLSVHDDAIASVCDQLSDVLPRATASQPYIVFHCSGALAAQPALQSAVAQGAGVGSLHPALNISEIVQAARVFPGTPCAVEGDSPQIRQQLQAMVRAMGGSPIEISAADKLLYHAALVIAGNSIGVLVEAALSLLTTRLAISEANAIGLIKPLVENTVERVLAEGPIQAATGPIVRGDCELVRAQLAALTRVDTTLSTLYRQLGHRLVAIVEQRNELSPAVLARLRELFH